MALTMIGDLQIVTPPTAYPIDTEEAKAHARDDIAADDILIDSYIAAATDYVQNVTGHQCVAAQFSLTLDDLVGDIVLPRYPLISIDSITYVDGDSASQTVTSTDYAADTKRRPGKVYQTFNNYWPTTRRHENDVTITYKAGHLSPFTAVAATDVCTFTGRAFADTDLVRITNSSGASGEVPGGLALQTDHYIRDQSGQTCKLALTSGGSAIDITSAGTGTHFFGVLPEGLRQAILMLVSHWYEQREPIVTGTIVAKIPMAVESLLAAERINWSF